MKIAIQGAAGSYHHIAAEKYYGTDNDLVYADTYTAVFAALSAGVADAAIIAIENSMYGSITEVYNLLKKYRYPIVGEIIERIELDLITFPDTKSGDIKRIYSHPVALAQCAHYLASKFPEAEIVQHHDTAAAVEYIKHGGDHSSAAIAGTAAAELHGMFVLQKNIHDEQQNYTRFFAVEPSGIPPESANKATLIMTTSHEYGSLHRALGVFADLGSNLTKLRSRPSLGGAESYDFYVDVDITPSGLASAIEMLRLQQCSVINLGTYKAAII